MFVKCEKSLMDKGPHACCGIFGVIKLEREDKNTHGKQWSKDRHKQRQSTYINFNNFNPAIF